MEPVLRYTPATDWITLLLIISLIFLILAKSMFYGRFLDFIILPFNNKYIFMYSKKEKLFNGFHLLLGVFQLLNMALFLYLAWHAFTAPVYDNSQYIFPLILAGLFLFLVLKLFLQLGNSFIFNSFPIISELIFKKLSYLNYASLVLFVANILLTYVYPDSKVVVAIASGLFVVINAIGWVTVIKNYQNFLTSYFFYFILYLCALEIAPIIIIGNFLK